MNGCNRHQCLKEFRDVIRQDRYARPEPPSVQLSWEPTQWVDDTRYLGMTLDKRPTWSKRIDHARKKAAQRLGKLGPLLNRRSGLSIRNAVLLCKQLIRPAMDP